MRYNFSFTHALLRLSVKGPWCIIGTEHASWQFLTVTDWYGMPVSWAILWSLTVPTCQDWLGDNVNYVVPNQSNINALEHMVLQRVWYDMIWYDMIWYDMMWYDVMWCDVMWCDVMWCGVVWCGVLCCVVWCDGMVWYGIWYIEGILPKGPCHA